MIIHPRRLLDDKNPLGYRESDLDYVMHNLEACVKYLDEQVEKQNKTGRTHELVDKTLSS